MSNDLLPCRLKELRKSYNYTQEYVASSIGTVRQTYSNYETGKRIPDAHIIYKLAGLYKISVDDLLSLTLDVDRAIGYNTYNKSFGTIKLEKYLKHVNDNANKTKYAYLNQEEKELLFGYKSLTEDDRLEIKTLINLKLQRRLMKKK